MGVKWTAAHRANFIKGMAERAAKLKKLNGSKASLGNVHQGILYLKAAERSIAHKPLKDLTEAEVYGHLAYKILTEKL